MGDTAPDVLPDVTWDPAGSLPGGAAALRCPHCGTGGAEQFERRGRWPRTTWPVIACRSCHGGLVVRRHGRIRVRHHIDRIPPELWRQMVERWNAEFADDPTFVAAVAPPAAAPPAATRPRPALRHPTVHERAALTAGADLAHRNLSGLVLRGARLARADLSHANLSGCDLTGADLRAALLIGTNLTGATLEKTDAAWAKLCGADLTDATCYRLVLDHADLSPHVTYGNRGGLVLHPTKLTRVWASKTSFAGANLELAWLDSGRFFGADFTGAHLLDAQFANADLVGAHFDLGLLRDARLHGATLRLQLPGADLRGVELSRTTLFHGRDGSDLRDADLTGANLAGASLRYSTLAGTNLTGANLAGADLTRADLTGADLTGADLTGTVLHGARLHGATVDAGVDLEGAYLGTSR